MRNDRCTPERELPDAASVPAAGDAEAVGAKAPKNRVFERFRVKDVVFISVMAAASMVTAAVMPLVAAVYIFGLPQIVTGLQFSLFPAIALMKTRKPGALLLFSVITGLIQLAMSPVMGVVSMTCGVALEGLTLLLFRGYKKDRAVFFASALYIPASLPVFYVYYAFIAGEVHAYVLNARVNPLPVILICLAVAALCALGAALGIKIARELKKSGVLKN
ncbi:MAG: hypothetical protein LBH24_01540 [Clostridiales bacterium]|jgi:hypothetical protein|nr:hypothetical protein [Clostridiales bacterium]